MPQDTSPQQINGPIVYFLNVFAADDVAAYFDTDTNKYYHVDLKNVTCNCWEFTVDRKVKEISDARRYCRHLLALANSKLTESSNINPDNEFARFAVAHYLTIRKAFPAKGLYYYPVIEGNKMMIIQNPDSEWFEVFARKKQYKDDTLCTGEIERHGYGRSNNRWAWGDGPFNPLAVKRYIRELPEFPQKEVDKKSAPYESILDEFIKIPEGMNISIPSIDGLVSRLDDEKDITKIIAVLKRLKFVHSVDQSAILQLWNKYHQFLSQASDAHSIALALPDWKSEEVLDSQAKDLPANNISLNQSYNERAKAQSDSVIISLQKMINLEGEKAKFDNVADGYSKAKAVSVLESKAPEWYDHSKGHTFWGYQYADFARAVVKDSKSFTGDVQCICDYIAFLAIIDGTISDATIAEMAKIKGLMADTRGENDKALAFLELARRMNPKISVKKKISELEKKIRMRKQ